MCQAMKMINTTASATRSSPVAKKSCCLKKKSMAKRSRKVAFANSIQVQRINSRDSLDKSALWHSSISYSDLFKRAVAFSPDDSYDVANFFSSVSEDQGKTPDVRGMEERDFFARRLHVAETVDAVLDIQVHQWSTGTRDPEQLAQVSQRYSVFSQAQAIDRATE